MTAPSEELARRIGDRLVAENLITEAEKEKLVPKLGQGDVDASTWRRTFELSEDEEA